MSDSEHYQFSDPDVSSLIDSPDSRLPFQNIMLKPFQVLERVSCRSKNNPWSKCQSDVEMVFGIQL